MEYTSSTVVACTVVSTQSRPRSMHAPCRKHEHTCIHSTYVKGQDRRRLPYVHDGVGLTTVVVMAWLLFPLRQQVFMRRERNMVICDDDGHGWSMVNEDDKQRRKLEWPRAKHLSPPEITTR